MLLIFIYGPKLILVKTFVKKAGHLDFSVKFPYLKGVVDQTKHAYGWLVGDDLSQLSFQQGLQCLVQLLLCAQWVSVKVFSCRFSNLHDSVTFKKFARFIGIKRLKFKL